MNKDFRKKFISLVLSLNMLTLAGCAKKVDCEIEPKHVHEYTTETGITRYIDSEREYVGGLFDTLRYYRSDNYIELNEDNEELYEFISRHGLVNVLDNKSTIENVYNTTYDYMVYRYKYTQIVTYTTSDGKGHTSVHTRPETRYSWTEDPNHSGLTGEYDVVTHVFYGYNIVVDKNGKYKLQKSGPVQGLDKLIKMGYTYIGEDICEEIRLSEYYRKLGIDFESNFDENDYDKSYEDGRVVLRLK